MADLVQKGAVEVRVSFARVEIIKKKAKQTLLEEKYELLEELRNKNVQTNSEYLLVARTFNVYPLISI